MSQPSGSFTPELIARLKEAAQAAAQYVGRPKWKSSEVAEIAATILMLAKMCHEAADALTLASEMPERMREAESIILRLTMDHNSTPNYVRGFDEARNYFAKYPPLPPMPERE